MVLLRNLIGNMISVFGLTDEHNGHLSQKPSGVGSVLSNTHWVTKSSAMFHM